MMKNKLLILLMLGLASLLSGCLKDALEDVAPVLPGEGRQLMLSINDTEDIETYSSASKYECQILNMYLLVFNSSGKYKTGEWVETHNIKDGGTKTPTITTMLNLAAGDEVVVLINAVRSKLAAIPLTVGQSTTADISAAFPSGDALAGTMSQFPSYKFKIWPISPTGEGRNLPMSGKFTVLASGNMVCDIYRSVAKFNVTLDPALDDVTGLFANANVYFTVYNGTKEGNIYSPNGAMSLPGTLTFGEYPTGSSPSQISIYTDTGSSPVLSYYMPEYNSSVRAKGAVVGSDMFHIDRMCVLVTIEIDKNTQKRVFYRLDLKDSQTGLYLDFQRNHQYTVKIKKVKSPGYATAAEALANPGSNLEYEILVKGDNDNIVTSNGQYALSMEYDEVIYTGDNTTEVSLGQIRGIDGSGIGLPSTRTITPSNGVTLTGATSVSATAQELKATMSNATGTITVKLGNIVQEIKLTRSEALIPASGKVITFAGDYAGTTWTQSPPFIRVIQNDPTSMKVAVNENIILTNASAVSDPAVVPAFASRSGEVYVLRTGAKPGRTKIIINQAAPECIGWFGGVPDNSLQSRYTKRLIVDSHDAPEIIMWYINNDVATNINNTETGLENTKGLMALNDPENYKVAHRCYMLNDRNGNGTIEADEPINWYLPAQNQLMSVWVVKTGLSTVFRPNYYWSSTEQKTTFGGVRDVSLKVGYSTFQYKTSLLNWSRCVRDL